MKLTLALALSFIGVLGVSAKAPTIPGDGTIKPVVPQPLPRALEIQLALSALPPHLREQATVYVLNPSRGFEVARKGTNDVHALVARTGDDTFRGSWPLTKFRDDILYPIAFDEAGSKAQMRVFLDAAELQAKGTPPRQLKEIIQSRYKTNVYKAPERAGVAYMLSPIVRTYTNPDVNEDAITLNIPHVMYFAPNLSNADIGGAIPTAEQFGYLAQHRHWPGSVYPFVILQGPHGYTVQFLGTTERAAMTDQYKEMLAKLCAIKDVWCLPVTKG
jgi:hypothetical protein